MRSSAARAIGRQVVIASVASARDFDAAFAQFIKAGAGALLVPGGSLTTGLSRQIVALAIRHAIPALYSLREFVDAGGLMSYGPSQTDAYRRAAASTLAAFLRARSPATCESNCRPSTTLPSTCNRQGHGAGNAADTARPRRRGDRITSCRGANVAYSHIAAQRRCGVMSAPGGRRHSGSERGVRVWVSALSMYSLKAQYAVC
jgi:hypothetical protein